MIEFDFTVNKSFLRYARPITVPQILRRSRLDGSNIERLESIKIICPDGTTLKGYIYSGWNNTTYYSQIKVRSTGLGTDPLRKYDVGVRLTIRIFENSDYIEIEEG